MKLSKTKHFVKHRINDFGAPCVEFSCNKFFNIFETATLKTGGLLIFLGFVFDIDAIVRVVKFPVWQTTSSGEREVQKSLRKALFKYKLHTDQDLFDRAYAYIKEYY